MKKVKIFKTHEEYGATPSGARYMTATFAKDAVEKFINRKDIKILSIHYAGGEKDDTMVIYREIKTK